MNGHQKSQSNKLNECYTENEFYSLYKVIGFGSKNNFSITKNELNGLIAWISGPYVVFYDIISDSQAFFLKNINNKIISCIQFSTNGKLFATGEGNCKNGEICLYDIFYDGNAKKKSYKLLLSYKSHKFGIEKLLFFKNDKYLLSIGNSEDKIMNIMDIENKKIIYSSMFNKNILSVDLSDDFAIICGYNFINLYEFNFNNNKNKNSNQNSNLNSIDLLIKKPVDLSKLKDKSFVYTSIYSNPKKNEKKIFFITEDCYLVEMNSNNLILNRWINLQANRGFNLTIWDNKIGCGCSDGIYRIFNVDNLNHIQTLHKPPPLGPENKIINNSKKNNNLVYPDVMCNLYSNYHKKLILVYSNKYFLVWDIKNTNQMNVIRYHIFQSGSIKTMDFSFDKKEKIIKIATCSDDKTVIYWNFKLEENNTLIEPKNNHITYSKYIRHIFYFSNNYEHFKLKKENISQNNNNNNNNENNNNNNKHFTKDNQLYEYEDIINLTSVKFSVDGKYLYIGDSIGNLFIYSLINNFEKIIEIPAHNEKINTIDTILYNQFENSNNNKIYLATGSSDNYFNIYDITSGFNKKNISINDFNTIFEKMNSEITNLVFCIDKNKKLKIIVGEENSTITFFQLAKGVLQTLQKYNEPNLKTYCLCFSSSINKIISGHNGKIIIWKTSSNIIHKHFHVSKGDKILDNFRIASDSSGVILATSNNDKNIRIRGIYDGKLLCKISVAESISNLLFVLDDNYLIATSIEGYIYFYKINQNFISKLKQDKILINSSEEKNIINNKLKLLQKLIENDVSLSKNSQVKYLLDKFQKSEDASIEDLKKLDEFVLDGSKNGIKNEEIIQIKEDKPNNNDDQENQNNDNDDTGNNNENNTNLSKSKLFELEEKKLNKNKKVKNKSPNRKRVSIIDNYIQKENTKKKDENDSKKNKFKKINLKELDLNNSNNSKKVKTLKEIKIIKKDKSPSSRPYLSPKNNPFWKSQTKNDYINSISSKRNKSNKAKENNLKFQKKDDNNTKNISNILNSNDFKIHIIDSEISSNSNLYNNQKYNTDSNINNISNNVLINSPRKKKFLICKNMRFNFIMKKNNSKNKFVKKDDGKKDIKEKLIKEIELIKVDKIEKKHDLILLKNKLELLRQKIRMKLNNNYKENEKEKLLEQFGDLLVDKISKYKKK